MNHCLINTTATSSAFAAASSSSLSPPAAARARSSSRWLRRIGTCLSIAALSVQSLVGCGVAPEGPGEAVTEDSSAPSEVVTTPQRLRISTELEGQRVEADLTIEGGLLSGTRTTTFTDGRTETEDLLVSIDRNSSAALDDALGASPLAGLRVVSAEASGESTHYQLETDSGLILQAEAVGEAEYFLAEATAIVITATIVCGTVTMTSIIACAANLRCWDYKLDLRNPVTLCAGRCKRC